MGYQGLSPSFFRGTFTTIQLLDTPLPHSPGPGSGFDGSQVDFKLQINGADIGKITANSILITLGGVTQRPGTDYTVSNGVLTFTTAPVSGLTIEVRRLQTTSSDFDLPQDVNVYRDLTVDTDTLYVDATNDRVGVNKSTPDNSFHVYGPADQVRIQDSANNNYGTIGVDGVNSNFNLDWNSSSLRKINLVNSGGGYVNVGVNTESPTTRLHINYGDASLPSGNCNASNSTIVLSGVDAHMDMLSSDDNSTVANSLGMGRYNNSTGALIDKWGLINWYNTGSQGSNTSSRLSFHYGTAASPWSSTELFTLKPSGYFGLGIDDPVYRLDVFNNANNNDSQIRVKNQYANVNAHAIVNIDGYGSSTLKFWRNGSENWKLERTTGTNDLTLTAYNTINSVTGYGDVQFWDFDTGNVGIKTTTPNAGASLHINSTDTIIVPAGTSAQRPSSNLVAGMVRYNSDTSQQSLEYYNGTAWISTNARGGTLSNPYTSIAAAQTDGASEGLHYFVNGNGDVQELYYDPSDSGWIMVSSNNAADTTIPTGTTRQNLAYTLHRNGTLGALGTADPDSDYIIGDWYSSFSFTRVRVYGFGDNSTNGTYTWSGNRGDYVDVQFPATSRNDVVLWSSGNVTWGGNSGGRHSSANYFSMDNIYQDNFNGGFSANANQCTIGGYASNTSADPSTGTYLGHGTNESTGSHEGWYTSLHGNQDAQGYTTWIR